MCHTPWFESWEQSPKGRSWEALQPGTCGEAKRVAGLDVDEDYRTDPSCLRCHSVGFGAPGGYEVPDPNDDWTQRFAATREGVGCESCHGPGSGFTQIMSDVKHTQRSYRIEELRAAGLQVVTPRACERCHNDEAVCIPPGKRRRIDATDLLYHPGDSPYRCGAHAPFTLKYRTKDTHEQ